MKVLVISDSHGNADQLNKIVKQVNADHVIHCEDFCTNKDQLPQGSISVVQGNCDFISVPQELVWMGKNYRFFITHGHQYHVKEQLLPIRYRGEEMDAHIVCFGHSHLPYCDQKNNILLINPGSISQPRGFPVPTYACLTLTDKNVQANFYQVSGKQVQSLGGTYVL